MESRSLDLTVRRIFPLYCYDLLRLLRMLIVFCFVYVRYSFLYVSVMFVLFCLLLRSFNDFRVPSLQQRVEYLQLMASRPFARVCLAFIDHNERKKCKVG